MVAKRCSIQTDRPRGTLLAMVLVAVVADIGAGGHRCHRTRACNRGGIPSGYDYPAVQTTPQVRAVSGVALPLRGKPPQAVSPAAQAGGTTPISPPGSAPVVVASPAPPQAKFYQLTQTQLAIDHCSISRVAILLEDNGHWRLSLQADQNPQGADTPSQTKIAALQGQPQKQTGHIKRNEFHVVIRGYGGYALQEAPDSTTLGKPVLFRVEVDPFWVQNSVPRDMVWEQMSNDVNKYFDLVDRIEIDFWYR